MTEIDKLTYLPYLRVISLVGKTSVSYIINYIGIIIDCPISEIDDYRIEILVRLRKLERLDKDQYTDDERGDAEDVIYVFANCVIYTYIYIAVYTETRRIS